MVGLEDLFVVTIAIAWLVTIIALDDTHHSPAGSSVPQPPT
jgi:hypothetical protein